jgi:elongation factor Ts
MELNAKLVMSLREKTKLPMMKCKEALLATKDSTANEDAWFEDAVKYLRKQGIASITDRTAGKEISNGGIGLSIVKNDSRGALVLLGCQTDFVANSDVFKDLAQWIAVAFASFANENPIGVNYENELKINDKSIADHLQEKSAQLGERLSLVEYKILEGIKVVGYNHGRIAGLVAGSGNADKLRNVALHVVAANPIPTALNKELLNPASVEKEKNFLLSLPEVASKPDAMKEKIVTGKLGRFFKENCLLEQEMLIDAEKKETVAQYTARHGVVVSGFSRIEVKFA